MSNKIDSYGPQVATSAPVRARSAEAGGKNAPAQARESVASSDSVRLTDDAKLLQQAERAAAQAPGPGGRGPDSRGVRDHAVERPA